MNLGKLIKIFSDKECTKVYVKTLAANDNSKNQVYLGGSFNVLNILPIQEIVSDNSGDWKRMRFKTKLDFYWLSEDGSVSIAPETQLILYPKYPEVRLSGFLKKCVNAPSDLMANRIEGRLLFLGLTRSRQIIAYVSAPDAALTNEFNATDGLQETGIFREITISAGSIESGTREKLLAELRRIHLLGWIDSKRLNAKKDILPCQNLNCGGYTLEAELGIPPNSYSGPDYLGWEIKQFNVKRFDKYDSAIVTLMTPKPTGGFYGDHGLEKFVNRFGYKDKKGRENRRNFGGIYKYGKVVPSTGLKFIVSGFDAEAKKINDADGYIGLIDDNDTLAATWSFSSLLTLWNKKHANACYVPSVKRKDSELYPFSGQQYSYGNNIILGVSTDFILFLNEVVAGNVYYDPAQKLILEEKGGAKKDSKERSQFRIKTRNLPNLYHHNEVVDLTNFQF